MGSLNYGDVVKGVSRATGEEHVACNIIDVKPVKFDGSLMEYVVCKPEDSDSTLIIYDDPLEVNRYLLIDNNCDNTYLLADAVRG